MKFAYVIPHGAENQCRTILGNETIVGGFVEYLSGLALSVEDPVMTHSLLATLPETASQGAVTIGRGIDLELLRDLTSRDRVSILT